MSLQQFKVHMAGQVVDQQNASLETMDTDKLFDLFAVTSEQTKPAGGAPGAEDGGDAMDEDDRAEDEYAREFGAGDGA